MRAGKVVTALPAVQEISPLPCDTGSDVGRLREEFGGGKQGGEVDLGMVGEGWNDKTGEGSLYAPVMARLEERAREARVWLRGLGREVGAKGEGEGEDAHVVVVTHGGFLHFLTGDW